MNYKKYLKELRFFNLIGIVLIGIMLTFTNIRNRNEIERIHNTIDSIRIDMNMNEVIKTNNDVKRAVDSLQTTLRLLTNCTKKTNMQFYKDLGHVESRGNYGIVNRFGYLGKYQFSLKTIHGLGFDVTKEDFLKDTLLQEKVVRTYIAFNKRILRKWIRRYNNKLFKVYDESGDSMIIVNITESGILAAAHLGGPGNVQKLFNEKTIFKDGFGMPITEYLKRFSGYKI